MKLGLSHKIAGLSALLTLLLGIGLLARPARAAGFQQSTPPAPTDSGLPTEYPGQPLPLPSPTAGPTEAYVPPPTAAPPTVFPSDTPGAYSGPATPAGPTAVASTQRVPFDLDDLTLVF